MAEKWMAAMDHMDCVLSVWNVYSETRDVSSHLGSSCNKYSWQKFTDSMKEMPRNLY